MPRRRRKDYPGAWHHVMNRGLARRTLFESGQDVWSFLDELIQEVEGGEIEVHAFSFLTTHFHLLLRSPRGHLSRVMQRVEDAYARNFNRGRQRDGPLFRGRFTNRLVESEAYWGAVLRYIDRNPVEAGLVDRPSVYPFGSARLYSSGEGPDWLRRDLVEDHVARDPLKGFLPQDYESFCDTELPEALRWLVERRLERRPPGGRDPLDDLLGAAPERVRAWMERRAKLADGTRPGWPLVSPSTVREVVSTLRGMEPEVPLKVPGSPGIPLSSALEVWILRMHAGLTLHEVGVRTGTSTATVHGRVRSCGKAFRDDESFRHRVGEVLAEAMVRDHGPAVRARIGTSGFLNFPEESLKD